MFTTFLPYLVAIILGIDGDGGQAVAVAPPDTAPAEAARAPEDQTPTGKFTTAGEVKPILAMTQANWVGLKADGQDYLYFTHLLAWRCGLWSVHYGINTDTADTELELEQCHDGTSSPNSITDVENYQLYLIRPIGSIETVAISLVFDDGTTASHVFDRLPITIP